MNKIVLVVETDLHAEKIKSEFPQSLITDDTESLRDQVKVFPGIRGKIKVGHFKIYLLTFFHNSVFHKRIMPLMYR